jgi:hypothetical protein
MKKLMSEDELRYAFQSREPEDMNRLWAEIAQMRNELEQLRALVAYLPEGWTAADEAARLKSAGETTRELLRLRALVAPVAEGWMAERSHVVGPTHELRDALNALAAGWTS